jgi:exosortase K
VNPDKKMLLPLGLYLIAAATMFALKQHYSAACADQLQWMLRPVAWIVARADAMAYAWRAGVGYVRTDQFITIAPACAGVNFFIMAYGLSIFAFLHQRHTMGGKVLWLFGAWIPAYGLSIAVNALRIVWAIRLYDHQVAWGWLTPERLHCAAGVGIYFSALGLYYAVLRRIMARSDQGTQTLKHCWLPWIWYVTGAWAVPVTHQLYRNGHWPAVEYGLMVMGVSAMIWGIGMTGSKIIANRIGRNRIANIGNSNIKAFRAAKKESYAP